MNCFTLDAILDNVSTSGNPYHISANVLAFVSILTFVVSSLSSNYSQTDKLWSIMPWLYAWTAVNDMRTMVMASLATIWGIRLTWNFNRRGGYCWPIWLGDEDYRWSYLKKGSFITLLTSPLVWHIFNFAFISCFQNFLLFMIAAPTFIAFEASKCAPKGLNLLDFVATILFLMFVIIESIADNQQFSFQKGKNEKIKNGETLKLDYRDGFLQMGLFAYSRKPNYAAEQAIWLSYYLFSISATGRIWNWSALGWIILCILFQMSARLTETISCSKYPKYEIYMKQVPLFFPKVSKFLGTMKSH
jgi:steroid 5-alpha reductase family enzyme